MRVSFPQGFPTECFLSQKIDISFFLGAGSDGLRVPVAGLTRVDTIQGKKERDNRKMAFGQACELTGEEYSQPIDLFMFTKSNRRVPYRLDLLMEQVRLTVSSCAYSIDSFLYGSCCFGSFEGEEGRTVLYWDFEETLRWCHFISLPDSTRKGNSIGEERMRQDSTPLSIYLWRARDERAEKV